MAPRFVGFCLLVGFLSLSGAAATSVAAVPSLTISGTVLGPTHQPLPRATVRLQTEPGAELARTLTDSQGRFRFDGLAAGRYTLVTELVGFETSTESVAAGGTVTVVLAVAPVKEEVVVTATRTDVPSGQIGASTRVVSDDELQSRLLVPVSDALRATVGTTVARSGGVGTTTSLFVRGGESDYTKIFLDGIPLNEPGGFFDFTNLLAENLESVEIVRGPQSALFGSDAVAGVVQLFTRRGRAETRRPRFVVGLEGGNLATWRGRVGLSGATGRFDYSLAGARFSTDNRSPNNAFHNTTLSANLGLRLNDRTSLRLVGRGELGRVGTPGQTAFARPDRDAFLRRRDAEAGVTLWNQTASSWEQRLSYSFTQSRQVSRDLIEDPPFTPSFQGRTAPFPFFDFTSDFLNLTRRHHLSYQSDWRTGSVGRAAGQHQITFAFEWDGERGFLGDRLFPGAEVHARRDNFGWVGQWQGIWSRLYLTLGGRVEDNDSFGTAVVPRASLAYYPRRSGGRLGATKLKFNFGLGIKEPSLIESFSPSPFFLGNPDLAPERTRSFDVGVEQRFWHDRGKLEVNWFDNRFRDLIGFEITDFVTFAGTFFNLGKTKAKGAEVVLELAPRRGLHGRASYTFLNSQVTRSGTVFDPVFEVGRPLLRRPRHSGALELYWDWRRLTLASTTLFVGQRADSDFALLGLTSNPGYTRWDLAATYRSAHRIAYFGAVENLLNQDYMEVLGFPALKLTVRAGARVEF